MSPSDTISRWAILTDEKGRDFKSSPFFVKTRNIPSPMKARNCAILFNPKDNFPDGNLNFSTDNFGVSLWGISKQVYIQYSRRNFAESDNSVTPCNAIVYTRVHNEHELQIQTWRCRQLSQFRPFDSECLKAKLKYRKTRYPKSYAMGRNFVPNL